MRQQHRQEPLRSRHSSNGGRSRSRCAAMRGEGPDSRWRHRAGSQEPRRQKREELETRQLASTEKSRSRHGSIAEHRIDESRRVEHGRMESRRIEHGRRGRVEESDVEHIKRTNLDVASMDESRRVEHGRRARRKEHERSTWNGRVSTRLARTSSSQMDASDEIRLRTSNRRVSTCRARTPSSRMDESR